MTRAPPSVDSSDTMAVRFLGPWSDFAVLGVIAAGLLARAYQADYNFDSDEAFSVRLAAHRFAEVITLSLADRPHPPLYNIVLHFWLSVFGISEVAARSLSIVFSVGFLVVSAVLLRRFAAPSIAAGALLLLAISPFFVYYGEQARPFALIALLAAGNLLAYFRLLENAGNRKRLVAWAVTCALLVYAQHVGILVIGLEVLVALLGLPAARLRILMVGAGAGLLVAPWAILGMGHAMLTHADPLSEISWIETPTITDLVWFYVAIFGSSAAHARWLGLVLAVLGVAYLGVTYFPGPVRRLRVPMEHVFILLMAFGLPGFCYLISVLGPKPIFASRHLISGALSLVAVLALCLDALPGAAAAGFISALALWMAVALPEAFPRSAKPPWRAIAGAIDASYRSAAIYTKESWIAAPLAYYLKSNTVSLLAPTAAPNELGAVLVMCRAHFCHDFESDPLKSRSSVVASWTWGVGAEHRYDLSVLRLYQLNSR